MQNTNVNNQTHKPKNKNKKTRTHKVNHRNKLHEQLKKTSNLSMQEHMQR